MDAAFHIDQCGGVGLGQTEFFGFVGDGRNGDEPLVT